MVGESDISYPDCLGGVWKIKKDLVGNSETLTSDEQFKDAVEEMISFIHHITSTIYGSRPYKRIKKKLHDLKKWRELKEESMEGIKGRV